ncbi:MAG: glycosyltransferase family 4 protein [Thermoplasmata archaeon]|nr:glycosyltransferase family 4 protein [Thermoplasmata archaeon]
MSTPKSSPRAFRRPIPVTKTELEPFTSELTWQRAPGVPKPRPPRVVEQRLRILMIGWEWPPHHSGGLGVHCFELCQELTRMGHRITFVLPFHGPRTEIAGVTFRTPGDTPEGPYPGAYEIGGSPTRWDSGDIGTFNAWIGTLSAKPFDVVHAHDWFGTAGGSAIARRDGRPFVQTIHSTEYDRSLGHPWPDVLAREQLGIDAADRVIAVSNHLKEQLVERYKARAEKVRVIYNAVRPSERLSALGGAKKIVLYLGRLAAMKGVDTFLRAAAQVARSEPGALFVVAGEGPEYPRLLTLAAHLDLSDRVLFLGKVTDEERTTLLASASVFVLPSVVEPFGIAALEAMAAGVPAIVSKTSGVAEITTGMFTVDFWDIDEFASRIAELLAYPVLRHTMGEEGRISATREGWEERAIQTAGVYREVLAGRRR